VVKIKLKYLVEDVDRHGNVRCYVRLPGKPKVRVRGMPGTAEFMTAYDAALATKTTDDNKTRKYQRAVKGSFGAACLGYYASAEFKALDASTQEWRRRNLDLICTKHGDKPIALMQAKHIRNLRDEKAATAPTAANQLLKALRALFTWAVEADIAQHDPTRDVRTVRYFSEGHHTWTTDEVKRFEQTHPIGTKARLAMALMLFTAGRKEDAVRLGPQHIHDGRLQYTQAKNEHRNPVHQDIPIHPELAEIITATPSGHLTFLITEHDKPFTPKHFGRVFKDWCYQAGLPHCSAHGLRKATASYLAEHGATHHEIMSITGHTSLKEIERYTRAARKAKLANAAMSRFKR
jgi:integrase/recombinase XerD